VTANLIYAVGTLLTWVGWVLAIRSVYLLARLATGAPEEKDRLLRALLITAVGTGIALGVGSIVPTNGVELAEGAKGPYRFPLTWFVMPWTAWLTTAGVVMAVVRACQSWLALNPIDGRERLKASGAWLVAAAVGAALYRRDPESSITILTGGIGMSFTTVGALFALATAAIAAMVVANRATRSRGVAKTVSAQLALLAGSIVFGLPFAFLVVTSFKEDRDMSSPTGIVWVPRVQDKVPYLDPKRPLYAGDFRGQRVEGEIIERKPDGTVKIDIFKPLAIRGTTFDAPMASLTQVPRDVEVVSVQYKGQEVKGMVVDNLDDGRKVVQVTEPATLKGQQETYLASDVKPVRHVGLRTENYTEALSFLPPETQGGLVYIKNTLILVVMSVLGTILSSSIVAYAFSRMRFPGRNGLFALVLSTMMLPGAVTMLPQFLIFRSLGWIDTLYPLWVPAFFGSAFNIFLLRQFFMQIPMELEDASKIDGCGYLRTFWTIMLPQIKPALAVIAVWTFVGAWNNFMGPLIYVNSPENMPLSYALKLFQGDRSGEPGLLMAFTTLTIIPVLALFFFAQRYFIEGVTLSGLGGR
jgi:multiple sugar transport system permease protein